MALSRFAPLMFRGSMNDPREAFALWSEDLVDHCLERCDAWKPHHWVLCKKGS